MADKYSTIQQHQPLRVPSGWGKQEKALIVQLDEVFDDIYRRFGRLRIEDMGEKFRKRIEDDEGNIAEITLDITGLTTRIGNAEGDISALNIRAGNIEISVANKYDKVSGITIDTNGIDISGSKYVKIESGCTLDIRTGGTLTIQSGNFGIDSFGNVTFKGSAEISSGKSLTIKSGGTFSVDSSNFAIDSSGNVTFKGTAEITSGKSLTIKSGGTFSIDSSNFAIDSSGNVSLKGGVEITSGKDLKVKSGGNFKVESGGTFDVVATNFVISSTDKKMVSGNWTFDNNGLLCDPGSTYKFSIVNTSSDMPSGTIGIIYTNATSGSLSSGLMKFVVRSKYSSINNMTALVLNSGQEGGSFYPENDVKMELGLSNKPFYKFYVDTAYITGNLKTSKIDANASSMTIDFKKTISGSEANESITVEMTDSRKLIISDGEKIVYKGNSFGGRYSYDAGTVNLNNKTTPTYEWCDTYSSNKPTGLTDDFLLEVIAVNPLASNPTIMQKITSTTGMYYRVRPSGGSWGSWYKFSCAAV